MKFKHERYYCITVSEHFLGGWIEEGDGFRTNVLEELSASLGISLQHASVAIYS
jgi:hypothetical protein